MDMDMDMDMGGGAPIPSMDGAKLENVAEAAPSPDFSMWTTEDDYLLKNNMEGGAAMEALAKGAVRFSHRFTLRELRERWGALLYDPEVSAQASAQMVRFGNFIAGTAKGARHTRKKDSMEALRKRKLNSVRTHYYRMRKRIALEQVPPPPFPNGPNGTTAEEDLDHPSHLNNNKPSEDDAFEQDVAAGFWLGKGDDATNDIESSMLSFLAEVGAEGDVGAISIDPEKIAEEDDVKPVITFDMDMATITAPPNNPASGETTLNMASQDTTKPPEGKPFEVPENPVESQKPEAIHEVVDMTPSLPSLIKEEDPHSVGQTLKASPMKVEIAGEAAKGTLPEQDVSDSDFMLDEKDEVSVILETDKMICVLNTEDMEIPSPPTYSDSPQSPPYSPVRSGFDGKNLGFSAGSESTHKVKRSMQSNYPGFSAPQGFRRGGLMQASTGESLLGLHIDAKCSVEAKHLIPSSHLNKAYQHTGKAEIEVQLSVDNGCIQLASSIGGAHEDELENTCVIGLHEAELAPSANAFNQDELAIPWQAMNSQGSEQDLLKDGIAGGIHSAGDAVAFQNSQFECYESEEEMANFSDVEAMILDMDLEPIDEEELPARAESRRLYKHHRKTIAMLEQCANASLQRSLSLRGAIAIIYGRHLKYYITKNEVTLGRGTQDNVVDIDLGKEGRANKVSRRQAIIKLKDDGTFDLNNLGRRIITVNNAPVRTSQRATLWSNCLIEIGGMYFIFDISRKLVKQRLEQMLQARNSG